MAITSNWPLSTDSIRFLTPQSLCEQLSYNPLTKAIYLIALGYYPRALSHQMFRNHHENTLLIYCTAGRGIVSIDNMDYPISAGDIVILPKGHAHRYASHTTDPWSIYWLHFDGELVDELITHLAMPQPVCAIGLQPNLIKQIDSLFRLRDCGYDLNAFIHGSHTLQQLLSYIALLIRQQANQTGKTIDLNAIQAVMNQHLHGQLDLQTLAEHSQLSKYHFSKRFKELTGHSPIQYFINLKVQHACWLLDIGQQQVSQIAASVGYDDPYYFSRLFKKVMGLSPEQYRKSKHR